MESIHITKVIPTRRNQCFISLHISASAQQLLYNIYCYQLLHVKGVSYKFYSNLSLAIYHCLPMMRITKPQLNKVYIKRHVQVLNYVIVQF